MSEPQLHFVCSWKSLVRMGHSLVGRVRHCLVDLLVDLLVDSSVDPSVGLCHRQCTTHNLTDNPLLYLLLAYTH